MNAKKGKRKSEVVTFTNRWEISILSNKIQRSESANTINRSIKRFNN